MSRGGRIVAAVAARGVVEGGLRKVSNGDKEGLAVAGLGLGGVQGKEDGLEASEGGGVGRMDAGEVESGEKREEGEDDES